MPMFVSFTIDDAAFFLSSMTLYTLHMCCTGIECRWCMHEFYLGCMDVLVTRSVLFEILHNCLFDSISLGFAFGALLIYLVTFA